jgi:hypothetical protein
VQSLLRFERSATVYWRKDGEAFAVSSDDLSGQATTWIFWPGTILEYVHLDLASAPDSLRRPCVPKSGIRLETLGWLDSRRLRLRLQGRDSTGRDCPEQVWTYAMPATPSGPRAHLFAGSPVAAGVAAYIVLRTLAAVVLIVLAGQRGVAGSRLLLQAGSDICLALGCLAYRDPAIGYHLGMILTLTGLYAVGWEIYSTLNDSMEEAADRPAEIPTLSAGEFGRGFLVVWRLLGEFRRGTCVLRRPVAAARSTYPLPCSSS